MSVKSHIKINKHKYIHFVDFTNPNISLCDPYCVGLVKQHNEQKRPFFYDMKGEADHFNYTDHPSILNRFYLEKEGSGSSNYSIYNGNKLFEKNEFDEKFIQHFKATTKYEKFKVIFDIGLIVASGIKRESSG